MEQKVNINCIRLINSIKVIKYSGQIPATNPHKNLIIFIIMKHRSRARVYFAIRLKEITFWINENCVNRNVHIFIEAVC